MNTPDPDRMPAAADQQPALAAVFDAVIDPLLLIDTARRRVLFANPAAGQLFGCQPEALADVRINEIAVHPDQFDKAIEARQHRIPLAYLRSGNDTHQPVEVNLRYFGGDQQPLCLASLRDRAEHLDAERARRAAERKYQGIFGAAPYPILLVDARQSIVDANQAALTQYGLDATDLVDPPRLGDLLADRKRAPGYLRPGNTRLPVHAHRRRDGSEFLAEVTVAATRIGRRSQWIVVVRDVTLEHAALADLHRSEERWRFALEGPGSGIWEWNPDTDDMFVSQRFLELLDLEEIPETTMSWWLGRIHPDDTPRANAAILAHLTSELPMIDTEVRLLGRDGRYHWIEVRAMTMARDRFGRAERVIGTVTIVDEKHRQLERERDYAEQLLHLDRLANMGEIATLIAHELNQPLAAIGNFAATALQQLDKNPQEVRRALELTQFLVQRAGDIVRQVRGFAQKKTPELREISLNDAIVEAMRFMEHSASTAAVRIRLEPAASLPPVRADATQIGQLVLNLAKNAIEASRELPAPRSITLRTETGSPGQVRLVVMDSGRGLPAELVDDLFQPFFTTKKTGLGMGLSICRTIAENHGGQLQAEPNHPSGTRFTVTLPVA